MIQRKYKALAAVYFGSDVLATNLALLAAYYLRFAVEVIPVTKGQQQLDVYVRLLPFATLLFPVAFALKGLYGRRQGESRLDEALGVLVATVLGALAFSGLLLWFRPGNPEAPYSRATLALFIACEVVFVTLGRSVIRSVMERRYRAGRNLERVLIAGGGEVARTLVERMRAHQELGFKIAGYIASDVSEAMGDLPYLGRLEDAGRIVATNDINHVYVAMPHESAGETVALLDQLVRETAAIHVVPDLLQFMAVRSRVEDLDGLPTINLSDTPLDGWNRVAKRSFDLATGAVVLLLTSPLMALIALAIYLEDRGPVFYRQVRMGLDGVAFEILKFRSMTLTAESQSGAVWARRDDPRRTRVGRFIRMWSLDELPQLWNVLRGDMSLVGPRPERPQFVEQFRAEFPHYMFRHKVRAGITGWAQVNGWRGNTSIRERIEHDLYYIENWSLLLDLKILLMTLRHGLRHENAY